MVSLSRIDLATNEDRRYQIDVWARLFKATTWEELKMLNANDTIFQEAAATMYEISEDERMRESLEAREDARRIENGRKKRFKKVVKERDAALEKLAQYEAKYGPLE